MDYFRKLAKASIYRPNVAWELKGVIVVFAIVCILNPGTGFEIFDHRWFSDPFYTS